MGNYRKISTSRYRKTRKVKSMKQYFLIWYSYTLQSIHTYQYIDFLPQSIDFTHSLTIPSLALKHPKHIFTNNSLAIPQDSLPGHKVDELGLPLIGLSE